MQMTRTPFSAASSFSQTLNYRGGAGSPLPRSAAFVGSSRMPATIQMPSSGISSLVQPLPSLSASRKQISPAMSYTVNTQAPPTLLGASTKATSVNIVSGSALPTAPRFSRSPIRSTIQAASPSMQVAKPLSAPVHNLLAGGNLIQEMRVSREELIAAGRLVELPLEGYVPAAFFSQQAFVSREPVAVASQPVMVVASAEPVTITDEPLSEPIVESPSTSSTKKGRLALLKGLRSGEVSKLVDTMEDANVVSNSIDVVEAAKAEALAREELEQALAAQQLAEAEALARAESEEASAQRLAALAAQGLVEEPSPDVAPVKGLAGRLARAGFGVN